jgi:hypothetical protein
LPNIASRREHRIDPNRNIATNPIFDDVDLSRALFLNCDVSEIWFTSSVRWAKRGRHGLEVFEESIPLGYATGLWRDGERDYRAIAQVYQQLKKNYDSRLDYWTANEFHFGEMEMKRLVTPLGGAYLGCGDGCSAGSV